MGFNCATFNITSRMSIIATCQYISLCRWYDLGSVFPSCTEVPYQATYQYR